MFRTTPLRGVGQRRSFLHDGRTDAVLKAVEEHFSPGMDCDETNSLAWGESGYARSGANAVVLRFRTLSAADQQAILDFLRAP